MRSRRPAAGLAMLEDDLLVTVLDMAAAMGGLKTAHFRPARTEEGWRTPVQGDGKGWLDLFILGPGGALWRETKSATGRLTPEQRAWMEALRAAGYDADVWRPADLASGRIQRELQAIRRRPRVPAGR